MRAVNVFECAFFRSVRLLVIDFDTELCFDIYLNRFGGIRSVIAKFRKDFSRNKVFVKILMSQMVYAMASMRLNRLLMRQIVVPLATGVAKRYQGHSSDLHFK